MYLKIFCYLKTFFQKISKIITDHHHILSNSVYLDKDFAAIISSQSFLLGFFVTDDHVADYVDAVDHEKHILTAWVFSSHCVPFFSWSFFFSFLQVWRSISCNISRSSVFVTNNIFIPLIFLVPFFYVFKMYLNDLLLY